MPTNLSFWYLMSVDFLRARMSLLPSMSLSLLLVDSICHPSIIMLIRMCPISSPRASIWSASPVGRSHSQG